LLTLSHALSTITQGRALNSELSTDATTSVISGFHHKADEICALKGCYAAYGGNSSPTFRDNLSDPFSRDMVLSFVTGQYTLNIEE